MKNFVGLVLALAMVCGLGTTARTAADGAAGVHPIVAEGILLGGVVDGKWTTAENLMGSVRGGERYKLFTLTKARGEATGTKAAEDDIGCIGVDFSGVANPAGLVGVVAGWNPMPRAPQPQGTNQQVYVDAVRQILNEHGVPKAKVRITQIVRVDLEGDGQEEVLLSATTPNPEYPSPDTKINDYSFVALRKIVGGQVKTVILDGQFITPESADNTSYKYELLGVLDLNADGVQEVLIHSEYYEGFGDTVYQIKGPEAKDVLSGGCGV